MNQRIKELADQALKECDVVKERGIEQYSKRFAELIVRECASLADHGHGMTGYELLEHFGVEE